MGHRAANIAAILDWCANYRPDIYANVQRVIELPGDQGAAFTLLMTASFEAGRMFQTTVPSPTTYEPFDVDYFIPETAHG